MTSLAPQGRHREVKLFTLQSQEELEMDLLTWAIIALVVSLIAGALGFSGVAAGAATIAKVLFGIFLVIAVLLFILALAGVALIT
jgi:uncharacterized membrane protein YtjA (UPF0391 family)